MCRQLLVRLLDVCWREPKMICAYYSLGRFPPKTSSCTYRNIFMVDGRVGHGGMFDRLKGAISVYAVSKVQGKPFKINFTYPFRLEDYLEPNNYDWRIPPEAVTSSFPDARPLFLYGECYRPDRLFKNRKCESHFYYGYDSLREINAKYGTTFDWGQLYRELFTPTAYLQKSINHYKKDIGKDYIAIHTRFLNLLGDKVETDINPELPGGEKEKLIVKIETEVNRIANEHGDVKILLASDSMTFIHYMQERYPFIYVVPGTVKHVDTAGKTTNDENLKMFLDYYLISSAVKVYNIVADGMWPSAFPEYAAKIGGVPFERRIEFG